MWCAYEVIFAVIILYTLPSSICFRLRWHEHVVISILLCILAQWIQRLFPSWQNELWEQKKCDCKMTEMTFDFNLKKMKCESIFWNNSHFKFDLLNIKTVEYFQILNYAFPVPFSNVELQPWRQNLLQQTWSHKKENHCKQPARKTEWMNTESLCVCKTDSQQIKQKNKGKHRPADWASRGFTCIAV